MKPTLKTSWASIRFSGLRPVCEAVEDALTAVGVDFYYLIGAQARDIWYAQEQLPITRFTLDVDFAILISSEAQFSAVKQILLQKHGFTDTKTNAFALRSPEGITVDLLPFGGIVNDDRVIVSGGGLTNIGVAGFREIANGGTAHISFEEDSAGFYFATLPAIVLLKILAFDDRPEARIKDAGDIIGILGYFFDLQEHLLFEVHYDTLEAIEGPLGRTHVSARIVGREIRLILAESTDLYNRVQTIMAAHKAQGTKSPLLRAMSVYSAIPVEDVMGILDSFRQGLNETAPGKALGQK